MSHQEWRNDEDGAPRDPDDQSRALVESFRALKRLDYRGKTLLSMLDATSTPPVVPLPLREVQMELALHFLVEGKPESANEDEIKALRLTGVLDINFNKSGQAKTQSEIPDKILLSIRDYITLPDHLLEGGSMRIIPLVING